ncbi:hypothetical protein AB1Y20_002233 [Prymnesium parvum]|uniref:Uncharacterized protein n=1 Tax=Prymnesium parvum TaxID=97485 RepID=A0AB34J8J1_PRYPA
MATTRALCICMAALSVPASAALCGTPSSRSQISPSPRSRAAWSSWRRRGVYAGREDILPLREIAASVGVAAPWTAPRWAWSLAWKCGHFALPLLHRWDPAAPADTNVNLWVLWLKAIAGNRRRTADGGLAYDMLPSATRRVVCRPVAWLYPRLHHQNVALRTAFLDKVVKAEAEAGANSSTIVCVLGAGFDVRPFRLSTQPDVSWVEIDLPHVVGQKLSLLRRLRDRRPALARQIDAVRHVQANLSHHEEMLAALRDALSPFRQTPTSTCSRRVVFVIEALMIYLPPAAAAALLASAVEEAAAAGASSVSVCFADRLPGAEGCSFQAARDVLAHAQLDLDESSWLPKPGLARHMGCARWAAATTES